MEIVHVQIGRRIRLSNVPVPYLYPTVTASEIKSYNGQGVSYQCGSTDGKTATNIYTNMKVFIAFEGLCESFDILPGQTVKDAKQMIKVIIYLYIDSVSIL